MISALMNLLPTVEDGQEIQELHCVNAAINIPQHTRHFIANSGEVSPYKGSWGQIMPSFRKKNSKDWEI